MLLPEPGVKTSTGSSTFTDVIVMVSSKLSDTQCEDSSTLVTAVGGLILVQHSNFGIGMQTAVMNYSLHKDSKLLDYKCSAHLLDCRAGTTSKLHYCRWTKFRVFPDTC